MNFKFIFATVVVLSCFRDARVKKWKRRDQPGCQRQIDALSVLMRKEVSRLDAKDSELMMTDMAIKDETRQVDRKYQMEVDRLDRKDEDLIAKDGVLMNKDRHLDAKDEMLAARQWALVKEIKVVKKWVVMAKVKLEEAHVKIDELKDNNTETNAKLEEATEKISELKENNTQTNAKLEEAHEKISELKENNTQANAKLEEAHVKIMELQNKTKIKAAFDGSVLGFGFETDVVVNNYVENTDDGSFFDETIGCFTAPCTGTYRFTVDVTTTLPSAFVDVVLRINGAKQLDTTVQPESDESSSFTVVRVVEEGSKVDVISQDENAEGNLRFSGHLINCQH